jgi:putative membrane protein
MTMYWVDHGMNGWGYLLPGLLWLGFWLLVVVAVALLVRGTTRSAPDRSGSAPEQLLAERYARGEIDDEEFRRRLDTLRRA